MKLRKPKTAPKLKQPYTNTKGQTVMLTDNQKQFTDAALTIRDSKKFINKVKEIYQTNTNSAQVIARQNFNKPNIIEYLGDRGYRALDVLNEAMTDTDANWSDRIKAADSIADRQFGRAVQTLQANTTSVSINIDLTGLES